MIWDLCPHGQIHCLKSTGRIYLALDEVGLDDSSKSPHPEEVLKASFRLFYMYFLSFKKSLQYLSESFRECDPGNEKTWKSIRGKALTSEKLVVGVETVFMETYLCTVCLRHTVCRGKATHYVGGKQLHTYVYRYTWTYFRYANSLASSPPKVQVIFHWLDSSIWGFFSPSFCSTSAVWNLSLG